jgi:hypothetical protein
MNEIEIKEKKEWTSPQLFIYFSQLVEDKTPLSYENSITGIAPSGLPS